MFVFPALLWGGGGRTLILLPEIKKINGNRKILVERGRAEIKYATHREKGSKFWNPHHVQQMCHTSVATAFSAQDEDIWIDKKAFPC